MALPKGVYHEGRSALPEELEMSLSDRLRKARTQHLIEAGLLPHDHSWLDGAAPDAAIEVTTEEIVLDDEPGGLFSPITIEARPVGLHLVAEAPLDLRELADGDGTATCPTCHGTADADMVDLVGHTVHYTCGNCSTMWQVRKPVVTDPVAR